MVVGVWIVLDGDDEGELLNAIEDEVLAGEFAGEVVGEGVAV